MIKHSKCWKCGADIKITVKEYNNPYKLITYDKQMNTKKNMHKREYCKSCKAETEAQRKIENEQYIALKTKAMIERAIILMEQQNIDVYEYKEAINAVSEKFTKDSKKFRSADEIVTAIILIQHKIPIKANYKIGIYTADIFILSSF